MKFAGFWRQIFQKQAETGIFLKEKKPGAIKIRHFHPKMVSLHEILRKETEFPHHFDVKKGKKKQIQEKSRYRKQINIIPIPAT